MNDVRDDEPGRGLTRRDMLLRGAAVGGALVWTVPLVQSVTPSAYATGSPAVKGIKTSHRPATLVEGTKLPHTGADFPLAQVVAAGTALVAGGAAVVARTRKPAVAEVDESGAAEMSVSGDQTDEADRG
jgi:LPXTG-motif cell wall-anchored protein